MPLPREGRQDDGGQPNFGELADLSPRDSPALQRRRLGFKIRQLREAAGLDIEQVARHLYCSSSKISRIETGQVSATVRDIRDIIDFCDVSDEQRDSLLELAHEARQRAWWHGFSGLSTTKAYISYEVAASLIRTFEAMVVPGLLQVEEYARTVISDMLPKPDHAEVERRLQLRMARQYLLREENAPPEFQVVLDEAVLRRMVGSPQIMRKQLEFLVEASTSPNVTLQIFPFSAGSHIGMSGEFTILHFPNPDDSDMVYLEHTAGDLYLHNVEAVERHELMFTNLQAMALGHQESISLIRRTIMEL